MSEGYFNYRTSKYEPWTAEIIISHAHEEIGPGTSDESYQRLAVIMRAAPQLLEALEFMIAETDPDNCGHEAMNKAKLAIDAAKLGYWNEGE